MASEDVDMNPAGMNGAEQEETSALHSNIKTKGQNSYYYAHKKREGVEVHEWDGNEAPRLLKKEQLKTDAVERIEPLTNYAWSDGKKKVSIYISLPNIGAHPEEDIQVDWTATTLDVRIRNFEGKTRVMALKLHDEISDVKTKQKENQLVLFLHKVKELSWYTLKKES